MTDQTTPEPFRLRNVRVRCSQSADLSSAASILRDIATPGMSDRDRAIAIWRFLYRHTYYSLYPKPLALRDGEHPVRHLNMAPWGECVWAAGMFRWLAAAAGLRRRVVNLGKEGRWDSHQVVEVWLDDGWRYFDTGAGQYFCLRDGHTIAGVDDLLADPSLITAPSSTAGFLSDPDPEGLREFARLSFSGSRMIVDDAALDPTAREDRCAMDLARGDIWTLSCEKEGESGAWYYPAALSNEDRKYAEWRCGYSLPGLGPRPIGTPLTPRWPLPGFANSRLEYTADFAGDGFRDRAVELVGLASGDGPCLHPERLREPGHVVFEITSPFIIVKARVEAAVAVLGQSTDRFAISVSTDADPRRRHWTNLARFDYDVRRCLLLDLTPHVYGAFKYWIRVDLYAADRTVRDVRLDSLKLVSVFQTSPMAAPRLGPGDNRITIEMDNPELLDRNGLEIEYCWTERRGVNEIVEKTDHRLIGAQETGHVVSVRDAKPDTRYVRMALAGGIPSPGNSSGAQQRCAVAC